MTAAEQEQGRKKESGFHCEAETASGRARFRSFFTGAPEKKKNPAIPMNGGVFDGGRGKD